MPREWRDNVVRKWRDNVVPARTLRSPRAGIGTELLAHREKIEVKRHRLAFVGLAHRHYTRAVCALPWRMPQT